MISSRFLKIVTFFFILIAMSACSNNETAKSKSWFDALPTITREWPRPTTSDAPPNTNIAHQQKNQNSPIELQEKVWEFLSNLPGMTTNNSTVSVNGARAVFTPDTLAATTGPGSKEWIHLHPSYDGSMHISLPNTDRTKQINDLGRWEPHPRNNKTLMLYGPRDDQELEVIKQIITAVYSLHELS